MQYDHESLIAEFLPRLRQNDYDVFFAGHEHMTNYAYSPKEEPVIQTEATAVYDILANLIVHEKHEQGCFSDYEWFPNGIPSNRTLDFKKGEHIHQFTVGAAGKPMNKLCPKQHT